MAVAKVLAAAFVAYLLTRAGWIFLDWIVVIVVLGLAAAAVICWRQRQRMLAIGLVAGLALSLVALSL
jgi:hypothetical protein